MNEDREDLAEMSSRSSTAPTGGGGHAVVYFTACDGTTTSAQLPPAGSGAGWFSQVLRAHCCPLCVGGCCAAERRPEFKRSLARVNTWISVLQGIMFIAAVGAGGGFASLEENPQFGPSDKGLVACGAKEGYRIIRGGQFHRLFTALLLHAGALHLAVNLTMQLRLCMHAERKWGTLRYVVIWLLGGMGGVLLSSILAAEKVSVGASACTVGVLAALSVNMYVVPDPRDPLRQFTWLMICLFALVMMIMGLFRAVDFSSHVGAVIVGLLLGGVFWGSSASWLANWPRAKRVFPWLMGLSVLAYFVVGLIVLYSGVAVDSDEIDQ